MTQRYPPSLRLDWQSPSRNFLQRRPLRLTDGLPIFISPSIPFFLDCMPPSVYYSGFEHLVAAACGRQSGSSQPIDQEMSS
jgi:hypothetical protein